MGFAEHRKRTFTEQAAKDLQVAWASDEPISIGGHQLRMGQVIAALLVKATQVQAAGDERVTKNKAPSSTPWLTGQGMPSSGSRASGGLGSGRRTSIQPVKPECGLADSASTDHDVDASILRRAASNLTPLPDE
jgi:hypothetical protein